MDEQKRKQIYLSFLSIALVVITILTSLVLKGPFFDSSQKITPTMTQFPITSHETTLLKLELEEINNRINEIETKINNSEFGNDYSASTIANIDSEISLMENRVQIIEDIIVDNPEKALSLLLIRQDIEYLRKDIDKLDELSKWSYGTSIGIGISLLLFVGTYIYGLFHKSNEHNNTKTTLDINH
jgi:hypothetical protein